MTTTCTYTYTGWGELTFGSYLAVAPDGETSTLVGTPGMTPVIIRRAGGNEQLPDVPALYWEPVDQATGESSEPVVTDAATSENEEVTD